MTDNVQFGEGDLKIGDIGARIGAFLDAFKNKIPFIDEDLALGQLLRELCDGIERQALPLSDMDIP